MNSASVQHTVGFVKNHMGAGGGGVLLFQSGILELMSPCSAYVTFSLSRVVNFFPNSIFWEGLPAQPRILG